MIPTKKFENRMAQAMKEVDELKHSTSAGKKEMKEILRQIYSDLISHEEIEIHSFMR